MAENPQDPQQGAAPDDAAGVDGVTAAADAANTTDQTAVAATGAMPAPTGAPANMPAPTAAPVSLPAPSGAPVIADLPAPVGFPVAAAPPAQDAAPTLDSLFAAPETAHLTETRQPEPVPSWVGSQPTSTIPPFGAAAPGSGTIDSTAAKRRRTLAIVIIAALVLVLAGGAVATVLLLKQNEAPAAPVAEQSAAQPAPTDTPEAGEVPEAPEAPEDGAIEEPDPRFEEPKPLGPADVPGSGSTRIPQGATALCSYNVTHEVEFYLFKTPRGLVYLGGNAERGFIELPAGEAAAGHYATNTDGTIYHFTPSKLTVTFPNGDGFEQEVKSRIDYDC